MAGRRTNAVRLIAGMALLAIEGRTCSVTGIISNIDMVRTADSVVRARAIEYTNPPRDPGIRTTGMTDSRIRFKVIETVRGEPIPDLVLPGYLVSTDDFNDQRPPYTFVRPGGRSGTCFANSYRVDSEFLLFLKKTKAGNFVLNWAPLSPVNEQLHSGDDPWLAWVRREAEKLKSASP